MRGSYIVIQSKMKISFNFHHYMDYYNQNNKFRVGRMVKHGNFFACDCYCHESPFIYKNIPYSILFSNLM
jgi:hypothetical protein